MQTTYLQKNGTVQKIAAAGSMASVPDSSSQSESLRRKADMANNAAQREEIPRPNNTGMPDNLKAGIESLSGFSMDDVRVHYNSSKPATVQALAYTQGTDIHVAPGQEKCLPHEAWHVAQQMAGRVSPTTNINGMPVNDNVGLEHEADVMGEKAIQKVDDNSSKNKGICSNVAQCKNCRAYFETKNEENCENSEYYVDEYSYVRIAPINAGRNPNQEYHEAFRNFLYVDNYKDMGILEGLFWYNSELRELWKYFDDESIEKIVSTACSKKALVFRNPRKGLIPFDWNSNESYHPGHPIEKVEPYKDPNENENLSFYKKRKESASAYAKENEIFFRRQLHEYLFSLYEQLLTERDSKERESIGRDIEKIKNCLRHGIPEKIMDKYFSLVWYGKIIESDSDGNGTEKFFKQRDEILPEETHSDGGSK